MVSMSMMAPEQIASEYGGDKRKIGQAVQMGLIDPTSAVMAGMFIDRMRSAAVQEQQPIQTVAQEVLNTQPPAQAPMQPPMQPQMQPPAQAPMQPSVERGLAALPVDESMIPGGEGYAGGGVVAFAGEEGSFVEDPSEIAALAIDPFSLEAIIANAEARRSNLPSGARDEAKKYFEGSSERAAAAADRQKWMAGLSAAAKLMSTRGGVGQALGAAGEAAIPGLQKAADISAGAEEARIKGMLGLEEKERSERLAGITAGEKMYGDERTLRSRETESAADRASRERQADLDRKNRMAIGNIPVKEMQVAAQLRRENPGRSYMDSVSQASQALSPKDTYNATRSALTAAAKDANTEFTNRLAYDAKLMEDSRKAAAGDVEAQKRVKAVRDAIQQQVFKAYQVEGVDLSSGTMNRTPPSGASSSRANDPLGIR